jgi:membrane protein
MARSKSSQGRRRTRGRLVHELSRRCSDHELTVYASAIAFRALVALIPLVLLALGLLGALGRKDAWRNSIAPAIEPRLTHPVFNAINASANKILSSGTAGLIAFASALVIWYLAVSISGVMRALNHVHEVEERRPLLRRASVAVALAAVVGVCVIGAILLLVSTPQAEGAVEVVLGIGRWLLLLGLLMLAVGLLVRFAPAEKPEARWASAGSVLVIGVWIVATLLFRLWATTVADFKTAVGTLTALLLLTAYLYVSSAIFLIGAELDELLRKETHGRGVAVSDLLVAVVRR